MMGYHLIGYTIHFDCANLAFTPAVEKLSDLMAAFTVHEILQPIPTV